MTWMRNRATKETPAVQEIKTEQIKEYFNETTPNVEIICV